MIILNTLKLIIFKKEVSVSYKNIASRSSVPSPLEAFLKQPKQWKAPVVKTRKKIEFDMIKTTNIKQKTVKQGEKWNPCWIKWSL